MLLETISAYMVKDKPNRFFIADIATYKQRKYAYMSRCGTTLYACLVPALVRTRECDSGIFYYPRTKSLPNYSTLRKPATVFLSE